MLTTDVLGKLARLCSFTLLLTFAVVAQMNTANVYGLLQDPSGAGIPNVKIEAVNQATGLHTSVSSNDDGQFTFNFLPIGTYSFTATAAGFTTQTQEQVQLSAGQTINLPFTLTVGALHEAVTVSGAAPLLNLETAEQHNTLESRTAHEVPLRNRDWTSLLSVGTGIRTAGTGGVSLNGLAPSSFNLTVDGTNASSDPEQPSLGFFGSFNVINTINSEAIEEVSVTQGIAPASVGGSMSGNVNIISKGGSNTFHGSLFETNSLSAYNARNPLLATKPRSTFNTFGGSISGPILRDKLFFFGDNATVRVSSFTAITDAVPTPEFRQLAVNSVPAYAHILSLFPNPNQPYAPGAQTGTYIAAGALRQEDGNSVARLDYYLSSTNLLTVRYTRSRPFRNLPRSIAENNTVTTGRNDSYNAQFTHSRPTWTFVTRFGYNRVNIRRLDRGILTGLDGISFGFNSLGAEDFIKQGGTYTFEETVAKNIGRHSLQFGGIVQRWNGGRTDASTNTFSYSTLADFLGNVPSSISVNFPLEPFDLRMYQYGGFIQDNFRVRPNLTINAGIRYDYFTVPKERDNRVFVRTANALGIGFGPYGDPNHMYNADYLNFAPRLGFSWSPGQDSKTVVRGGGGIFVNPHTLFGGPVDTVLTNGSVPFRLTLNRTQSLASGLKFPVNTAALQAQLVSSQTPIANAVIAQDFPNPYSMQWYFGMQRQLPSSLVLDAAYVGNRSLHLNMVRTQNYPNRLTGIAPFPAFGTFRYYDGSDSSTYHSLQISLKKRYSHGLTAGVYYTWASNLSYGDADLLLQAVPQDNNNIRADHGPTPYDVRQTLNATLVYELPLTRALGLNGRASKLILDGWQVSAIPVFQTGLPVNITDTRSSYANSRPDVNGVNTYLDNSQSTLQLLNPAAFVGVPIASVSGAQIRPGNLGRYALRAPGIINFDASAAKNFYITERVRVQFRADAFDVFNHRNLGGLGNRINLATFGRLTTSSSRTVQLEARLVF